MSLEIRSGTGIKIVIWIIGLFFACFSPKSPWTLFSFLLKTCLYPAYFLRFFCPPLCWIIVFPTFLYYSGFPRFLSMLQIMIRCLTIYHAKLCLLYPLNNSHYLQISYKSQNDFKDFLFNNNSKTAALFPDTAVRVYQYPIFAFLLSLNFFLLYRQGGTNGASICTNTIFSSPFSVSQ